MKEVTPSMVEVFRDGYGGTHDTRGKALASGLVASITKILFCGGPTPFKLSEISIVNEFVHVIKKHPEKIGDIIAELKEYERLTS